MKKHNIKHILQNKIGNNTAR